MKRLLIATAPTSILVSLTAAEPVAEQEALRAGASCDALTGTRDLAILDAEVTTTQSGGVS